MKTVVSLQDLVDAEIRPQNLLAEYYVRLERDVRAFWARAQLHDVTCPGCSRAETAVAFERFGATYRQCATCGSVFVSPRPDEEALVSFYRTSPAARYWRDQVWPSTEATRREKLARPRAEWVIEGLAEYASTAVAGLDLSPYGGPVIEELSAEGKRMTAGGWLADIEMGSSSSKIDVRPLRTSSIGVVSPVDFVTAFDMVDRAADAPALFRAVAGVLPPGGLMFLTASNADGFDLQVLWEQAPTFSPPDKLNVLSIDGMLSLFGGPAWEVLECSTPGLFDVEQVRRAVAADPTANWPGMVRRLLARGPSAAEDFQEFLQRHRLASFARLVVRRC